MHSYHALTHVCVVVVFVACKPHPCVTYSRSRDRINLALLCSYDKGRWYTPHPFPHCPPQATSANEQIIQDMAPDTGFIPSTHTQCDPSNTHTRTHTHTRPAFVDLEPSFGLAEEVPALCPHNRENVAQHTGNVYISRGHSVCANSVGLAFFPGFLNFSSDAPKYRSLGGGGVYVCFLKSV